MNQASLALSLSTKKTRRQMLLDQLDQFGFVKGRYCGLKKNTAQLFTLFAPSNLWMVYAKLMGMQA